MKRVIALMPLVHGGVLAASVTATKDLRAGELRIEVGLSDLLLQREGGTHRARAVQVLDALERTVA